MSHIIKKNKLCQKIHNKYFFIKRAMIIINNKLIYATDI